MVRIVHPTFTFSAAAVVINDDRQVLLLNHVLRPYSGWGLPGGFIERGEQAEDGVRREIREETGIELRDVRLLRVRTVDTQIECIFAARADREPVVKTNEIYGLGWFALDDLPDGLPRAQREIVAEVLSG